MTWSVAQAGVAVPASFASRSDAARSVSSRFGNAKRSFVRPSSGREKNDEPGTAATPGSCDQPPGERDVVVGRSGPAMSVIT